MRNRQPKIESTSETSSESALTTHIDLLLGELEWGPATGGHEGEERRNRLFPILDGSSIYVAQSRSASEPRRVLNIIQAPDMGDDTKRFVSWWSDGTDLRPEQEQAARALLGRIEASNEATQDAQENA